MHVACSAVAHAHAKKTPVDVVPNSNPLGIKRFDSGISISFKSECHIIMQIQYITNLIPGRFELGTTLR